MAKKLSTEEREELIDHLLGNCDCEQDEPLFNEESSDTLNGMTDRQLLLLVENAKRMVEVEVEEPEEEEVMEEEPVMEDEEEPVMEDEEEPVMEEEEVVEPVMKKKKRVPAVLNEADLPTEMQEDLKFARNMRQQQKDGLIAKITNNKNGLFTVNELKTKSVDELTKIASYAASNVGGMLPPTSKAVPRVAGHKIPTTNSSSTDKDILEAPVIDWN